LPLDGFQMDYIAPGWDVYLVDLRGMVNLRPPEMAARRRKTGRS
jgi:hypothetical protein